MPMARTIGVDEVSGFLVHEPPVRPVDSHAAVGIPVRVYSMASRFTALSDIIDAVKPICDADMSIATLPDRDVLLANELGRGGRCSV